MSRRPRILLTNDDGVRAEGLRAVYAELTKIADVTVAAPTEQRSGMSHAITLERPLRATPLTDLPGWSVEYTPVDCVKLAIRNLMPEKPDLVVSGINKGSNAGHLVHYSGTVGAAIEAVLNGVPALATSLCGWRECNYEYAAKLTREVAGKLLGRPELLRTDVVYNLNVPNLPESRVKGLRVCRQSLQLLPDDYEPRKDPRGEPYFWLTGVFKFEGLEKDDDLTAVQEGYAALTPLRVDWSHVEVAKGLREIF